LAAILQLTHAFSNPHLLLPILSLMLLLVPLRPIIILGLPLLPMPPLLILTLHRPTFAASLAPIMTRTVLIPLRHPLVMLWTTCRTTTGCRRGRRRRRRRRMI
jgi:hypothetical protein